MRLAPIPMYYSNNPEEALKYAALSSKTTHANEMCVDACRYMAGIIVGLLNGESKETVLSSMYSPVKNYFNNTFIFDNFGMESLIDNEFFNNGTLRDVEIDQSVFDSFFENHTKTFNDLAEMFIKNIK